MKLSELGPLIGSSLKSGADAIADIYAEHAPRIWTGVCVTGVIFLPFMSANAMAKSIRLIEVEEERLGRKLKKREVFKLCWKCWLGTTVTTGVAAGSALMSLEESEKKIAIMATSIQVLSEANKTDILNKVEEVAGKKKRNEVENRLADEQGKTFCEDNAQYNKFGDDWWNEPYTGLWWWGTRNQIDRAYNHIHERQLDGETCYFGDYLDEIGIQTNSRLKYIVLANDFKLREPGIGRLPNGNSCQVISYTECPFDLDSLTNVLKMRFWDYE